MLLPTGGALSFAGVPHMVSVFDPTSTAPVVELRVEVRWIGRPFVFWRTENLPTPIRPFGPVDLKRSVPPGSIVCGKLWGGNASPGYAPRAGSWHTATLACALHDQDRLYIRL